MLRDLLKKLANSDKGTEVKAQAVVINYTLFDTEGLKIGGIILTHQNNTYSDFSLKSSGSFSITSQQGTFWWDTSGKVLVDFNVSFTEGHEQDSLQGTLTLMDGLLETNHGKWTANVRNAGQDVAKFKGTWLRQTLQEI